MSSEASNDNTLLKLGLVAIIAFFAYAIYSGMKIESVKVGNVEVKASPGAGSTTQPPAEQPRVTNQNAQPVEPVVSPQIQTNINTQPTNSQPVQNGLMMDTNGDGYQDTRYWNYDFNHDGYLDAVYFDTDLNGRVNQQLLYDSTQPNGKVWCYDTNEDGVIDFWGWDKNNDNIVETWGWDLNHNNVFDCWTADYNGDGMADGYSYDDNEDGVIDRYY